MLTVSSILKFITRAVFLFFLFTIQLLTAIKLNQHENLINNCQGGSYSDVTEVSQHEKELNTVANSKSEFQWRVNCSEERVLLAFPNKYLALNRSLAVRVYRSDYLMLWRRTLVPARYKWESAGRCLISKSHGSTGSFPTSSDQLGYQFY